MLRTKETYTAKLQHASLAMCKPTVSNVLAVCVQQREQGLIKEGQKYRSTSLLQVRQTYN